MTPPAPPPPAPPLPPKKPAAATPTPTPMSAVHADWMAQTDAWRAAALAGEGPVGKIDPKDVRVMMGPPMDEATFKEWQRRRGGGR